VPSGTAATRIRLRRQQLGMTQAQLAAKVGVHVATVTSWEAGTFPSRHQGKVEAVLGISLDGDELDPREEELRDLGADRGGFLTASEVEHLVASYRRRKRPPSARAG
jgi:transcriptional regulator with XRE-family HTH domain